MLKKILLILFLSTGISMAAKIETETVTFSNTVNVASNLMVKGSNLFGVVSGDGILTPDADTLDGYQASAFAKTNDTVAFPLPNCTQISNIWVSSTGQVGIGTNANMTSAFTIVDKPGYTGKLRIFDTNGINRVRVDAGFSYYITDANNVDQIALGNSGAATFGGVITGNGAGITNIPEVVVPTLTQGSLGFTLIDYYGGVYGVAYSDTDAIVCSSFFVRKGGTFKLAMVWNTNGANTSKTMASHIYANAITTGVALSWNIFSVLDWNIAIPDADATITVSTYGTSFAVSDSSYVSVYFAKTDNAGGASGNLYVHGLVLIRQ